ncbi:MAG: GNAT family N-acetyltransferase [Chloroflexi bacterium]|nr:GNAT family N-acetyltransferase [Chloroflexota bacterium]
MNRAAAFPLETERLLIRPPQLSDVLPVLEAIRETYDQLHRWMDWACSHEKGGQEKATDEHVRLGLHQWQELQQGRPADPLPLFLFRRSDGHFLGASGFHDCVWEVPRLEIGYWLRHSEQGRGYMTEAVRAISEVAFLQWRAQRLSIACDASNAASQRVAERCGFAHEARLHHHRRRVDGVLEDTLIYARYAP